MASSSFLVLCSFPFQPSQKNIIYYPFSHPSQDQRLHWVQTCLAFLPVNDALWFIAHLLHWGVDVLSLCLEEAQNLLTLGDLRGESDQRLWRNTGEVKKRWSTPIKSPSVTQPSCFKLNHGLYDWPTGLENNWQSLNPWVMKSSTTAVINLMPACSKYLTYGSKSSGQSAHWWIPRNYCDSLNIIHDVCIQQIQIYDHVLYVTRKRREVPQNETHFWSRADFNFYFYFKSVRTSAAVQQPLSGLFCAPNASDLRQTGQEVTQRNTTYKTTYKTKYNEWQMWSYLWYLSLSKQNAGRKAKKNLAYDPWKEILDGAKTALKSYTTEFYTCNSNRC